MNTVIKFKNIFKWISFVLLLLVTTTTLTTLIGQRVSTETAITDKIYGLNCSLCVISIVSACIYLVGIWFLKSDNTYNKNAKDSSHKFDIKETIKKIWPCILLVVFMGWTAVGCIQASMEASAEAALRDEIEENDTERNKEIAAWTEGDRMENAADRSWNGCNNLKDGYFSFLFYAMVVVNVIMLGANSDNLKIWILRVLLISAMLLVLFSLLAFYNSNFLGGIVKYNRAIFNNSNHYGYYLCISTVLAAMMFVKEKNIFFKGISLISFVMMTFVLIVNNTFGAYLGVAAAIISIVLFTIVKAIKDLINDKKKDAIKDILKVSVISIIFMLFSATVCGINMTRVKTSQNAYIYYSNIFLEVKDVKYRIAYNKYNGFELKEDKTSTKEPIAQTNFAQLSKDAAIIFDFFKKDETDITTNEEAVDDKSGLTEDVSKTGSGRGEVWIKSLDLIKQRPVFGWGLENMLNEFYTQYGINEGRTHNLILQLAGTTGIFGMLFYMIAVIAIFFKVLFNCKNWGMVEYVTMPIFVSYMVSSMFGNSAFYTSPYFMIILGMLIASMLFKGNNKDLEKETLKQIKHD